jgi:hypothetical protein
MRRVRQRRLDLLEHERSFAPGKPPDDEKIDFISNRTFLNFCQIFGADETVLTALFGSELEVMVSVLNEVSVNGENLAKPFFGNHMHESYLYKTAEETFCSLARLAVSS